MRLREGRWDLSTSRYPLRGPKRAGSGAQSARAAWVCTILAFGIFAWAPPARAGEVFAGALAHDFNVGLSSAPRENHTTDVELGLRTRPFEGLRYLLRPMAFFQAELSTGRHTNFYAVGLEWRRDLFHSRFYGSFGLGLAGVDGYVNPPDYVAPGLTPAEAQRGRYLYQTNKAMGSDVVFNSGLAAGYRLTPALAAELTWQHYSTAGLFGKANPGMDNIGARFAYRFGGPF
jgi:hypothetical protein